MRFIQTDFYQYQPDQLFEALVSDPPYKDCLTHQLNEQNFDIGSFMTKAYNILKPNSAMILFTNMMMAQDLRYCAKEVGFEFITYQIWHKPNVRTWIAWSRPLRSCEFILYFTKGTFKFDFRTGEVKAPVKRSSFGGGVKGDFC